MLINVTNGQFNIKKLAVRACHWRAYFETLGKEMRAQESESVWAYKCKPS